MTTWVAELEYLRAIVRVVGNPVWGPEELRRTRWRTYVDHFGFHIVKILTPLDNGESSGKENGNWFMGIRDQEL